VKGKGRKGPPRKTEKIRKGSKRQRTFVPVRGKRGGGSRQTKLITLVKRKNKGEGERGEPGKRVPRERKIGVGAVCTKTKDFLGSKWEESENVTR